MKFHFKLGRTASCCKEEIQLKGKRFNDILEIQQNYHQILSGIKEEEFQTGYVKVGGQEQVMDDSSI